MSLDKIQPLKIESIAGGGDSNDEYPTGADPQHDLVETAGIVINDADHRDETTVIKRVGNDLLFKDGNNTTDFTLTQLAAGGSTDTSKWLLEVSGSIVYINDGEFVLKA